MKSIGEILKEERIAQKLTLEHIVKETHIPKQHLEALENDAYSQIPGNESSLLGFLRMYAMTLGMDADKVVSVYKNYRLMDEQAPYEELLKKDIGWKKIALLVVGIFFTILLIFLFTKFFITQSTWGESTFIKLKSNKIEHVKKKVSIDKPLVISIDDNMYKMNFSAYSDFEILAILSGDDQRQEFILSTNSSEPFSIVLSSLSSHIETPSTLRISLEKILNDKKIIISIEAENYLVVSNAVEEYTEPLAITAPDDKKELDINVNLTPRFQKQVVMSVRSGIAVNPIISFKGYAYYRHRLDNSEVVENYYQSGEQIQRTMHSNMKIWTSNAGRTTVKIGLNEIILGKDGEVAVKLLHWQRNATTGMLDLILEDV